MEITIKSHRAPLTSGLNWVVSFEGSPEEIEAVEGPVIRIIETISDSKTPVITKLEAEHEPEEPVSQ